MKNLFLIVCMLSFTSGFSQSKKDNTIILPFVSWDLIKSTLFQNAYSIQGDSVYISTSSKELKNVAVAVKMMILRTDTATYIKGLCRPTISLSFGGVQLNSDFEQLYFGGEKGSGLRKAWLEMDRVARLLSPDIRYAKQ